MDPILRAVEKKDLPTIRRWRNHASINEYMFTQHEVTEAEHLAWFEASKANKLRTQLLYEAFDGIKGFTQLQETSEGSGVYEWGFYVSPEAEAGSGTIMAKLVFDKLFMEMNARKLCGEVLSFNKPSIMFHQKLGFHQDNLLEAHHHLNGKRYDVYCFVLLKYEWLKII